MDVRYLNNPFQDYSKESKSSVVNSIGDDLNEEFKKRLSAGTVKLIGDLERNSQDWYDVYDTSLYTGLSGVAYAFYHYGHYYDNSEYISKASKCLTECIKELRGKRDITFLTGHAGVYALASVVFNLSKDKDFKDLILKLKQMSSNVINAKSVPDELLYGRVGYLYSLLFVNKYISPSPIEDDLIKQVITNILDSGKAYAKSRGFKSPIMYKWHDSEYLGGAHGLAGILYILLQAREYLSENQLKEEVEPALQWLESLKYPSGNFPSSVGRTTDKLVHWCHGAPSMTMLFCLAYEIFQKEQYLNTALKCGEVIWERGLLKKGCGICHGVAGNAYSFLSLFQLTKDTKHLYRAGKFAEWCLDYKIHQERPADRPFSLFEGLAGTIYFLTDMKNPLKAKFPGYTL